MQLGTPLHLDSDTLQGDLSEVPSADGFAGESDATLDLLHNCVEAMSLLQAKFMALEVETKIKLDATHRELAQTRSALAEAHAAIETGGQRLQESEGRIALLETGAADIARLHADDLAAARTESSIWRMRVETDSLGFEHLKSRLASLEEGLVAKLAGATQEIETQAAEKTRLQDVADTTQAHADRLQARLRDVDATIADQRSRITSLQNKLATATYTIRMEQMARNAEPPVFADDRDILDLQIAGKARVSAA